MLYWYFSTKWSWILSMFIHAFIHFFVSLLCWWSGPVRFRINPVYSSQLLNYCAGSTERLLVLSICFVAANMATRCPDFSSTWLKIPGSVATNAAGSRPDVSLNKSSLVTTKAAKHLSQISLKISSLKKSFSPEMQLENVPTSHQNIRFCRCKHGDVLSWLLIKKSGQI